jgi:hypothetical protein
MITRNYPYSDALMLAGGKVVAANLRSCIKELSDIRSKWTRGYITDLDNRLDNAFSEILGLSLPNVLQFLKFDIFDSLQKVAFDLTCLKIQIEVDCQSNPDKMNGCLATLGLTMYSKRLTSLSEEELICLLEHFEMNLSAGLRAELVGNGISSLLLDRLMQQAAQLKEMKEIQASLVSFSNEDLDEQKVAMLCALYNEVKGICTIASTYFEKKQKKQELFTFQVVIERLKGLCGEDLRLI